MADILIILPAKDFEEIIFTRVRDVLKNARHTIHTASYADVAISDTDKEIIVDSLVQESDIADYDALIVLGSSSIDTSPVDTKTSEMCKQTLEQGKFLAAIGTGVYALAQADILEGKRVAFLATEDVNPNEQGMHVTDNALEVDGQIITAKDKEASRDFANAIVAAFDAENARLSPAETNPEPVETPPNPPARAQEKRPVTVAEVLREHEEAQKEAAEKKE